MIRNTTSCAIGVCDSRCHAHQWCISSSLLSTQAASVDGNSQLNVKTNLQGQIAKPRCMLPRDWTGSFFGKNLRHQLYSNQVNAMQVHARVHEPPVLLAIKKTDEKLVQHYGFCQPMLQGQSQTLLPFSTFSSTSSALTLHTARSLHAQRTTCIQMQGCHSGVGEQSDVGGHGLT